MVATLSISAFFSGRILMNKKNHVFRTVLIFIVVSLFVVLTACKTEDVTKRAENEEKVLKAMIEYPGEGLYDPVVTVIGIGVGDSDEPNTLEISVERSNINFDADNVSKRLSMICSKDFDKIIDTKSKSIVWKADN